MLVLLWELLLPLTLMLLLVVSWLLLFDAVAVVVVVVDGDTVMAVCVIDSVV